MISSHHPRRRAARAALEAIHRHYGVTSTSASASSSSPSASASSSSPSASASSSSPSASSSFFEASVKSKFVDQASDYMKTAEAIPYSSPNGRKQRYAIYAKLFHHASDHAGLLNTMPQVRRTILRKVEEFEKQLATHREQFQAEEIKQTLRQLATHTRKVFGLFPYMEVVYQQKLNALIQHVEEYEKDVVAIELRDAMTRLKEALQST